VPGEFNIPWILLPLFFAVAVLYSTVGHGGASGYLALFAIFGVVNPKIAPIALALNVIVAGCAFLVYRQSGYFRLALLVPFALTSIPFAYIGASLRTSDEIFSLSLGFILSLIALRMFFPNPAGKTQEEQMTKGIKFWALAGLIGAILGFLSGMIGIGGGIFLSPIILLLGWGDIKETAAVSSAFIVLNSLSGLAGHIMRGNIAWTPTIVLGLAVFLGGLLGSLYGAKFGSSRLLRATLGMVLLFASFKLVVTGISLPSH